MAPKYGTRNEYGYDLMEDFSVRHPLRKRNGLYVKVNIDHDYGPGEWTMEYRNKNDNEGTKSTAEGNGLDTLLNTARMVMEDGCDVWMTVASDAALGVRN